MDLNDNYSVKDFGSNYILEPLRPGPGKTMKTPGGVPRIWELVESGGFLHGISEAPGLYMKVLPYMYIYIYIYTYIYIYIYIY